MSKIIAFGLYGNQPKYTIGAIQNAELAPTIYPGWSVVVYHDRTVPRDIVEKLKDLNVDTRRVEERKIDYCGKHCWRFLVNDDPEMERFISRDTDSRINQREADMVYIWEQSGKPFHVIRDHPKHLKPIMAGMWGSVRGFLPSMEVLLRGWKNKSSAYGHDEEFLRYTVWPKAKTACIEHDINKGTFQKCKDGRFVGEVFNEKNEPIEWTPGIQTA